MTASYYPAPLHGVAGRGCPISDAPPRRGPESVAVAVRRMRLAAEPFVGRHAAKEASNTVASVIVLDPLGEGAEDVAELAASSLRRLQRADLLGGSPRVGADVDVKTVAEAMAKAWVGS